MGYTTLLIAGALILVTGLGYLIDPAKPVITESHAESAPGKTIGTGQLDILDPDTFSKVEAILTRTLCSELGQSPNFRELNLCQTFVTAMTRCAPDSEQYAAGNFFASKINMLYGEQIEQEKSLIRFLKLFT